VTITPAMRFEVSRRIREEYENGRDYYGLHGREVAAPEDVARRPAQTALAWHNEVVFRG
jgi:putative restriction endonuclease